jgi:hypothetical protein
MLPADARIISVDDHAIEHPRVWLDRLPAKHAEAAIDDPLRRPRPPTTGGLKP